jgi:phosphatidylglycerol---prolipoprotein diacylglyceryl transferase
MFLTLSYLQWNPNREIFTIPYLNFPIGWYSLFFALGFAFGYYIFFCFLKRYFSNFSYLEESREKAIYVTDKVMFYMVIATVIGARIGHLLFYESPSFYLLHPFAIFKIWEGGLASHGAAFAIIIALAILGRKLSKFSPKLSLLTLLDLVSLPTSLAAVFIRIGNFFNQEILGKKTDSFLGVLFLNPADGSLPAIRHPAQLYEAFFYLLLFLVLLYLSYKPKVYLKKGKMIGLFLLTIFTFRFFIEFIKERQSALLSEDSLLIMGQYLSIPLILLGLFFFFREMFVKDKAFTECD